MPNTQVRIGKSTREVFKAAESRTNDGVGQPVSEYNP